jgi:hypothetical protein
MTYRIGKKVFEAEGPCLTLELCDSTALMDDPAALHAQLEEDGYPYLYGLHDADVVTQTRCEILEKLAARDQLDPSAPLMEGIASQAAPENATSSVKGNAANDENHQQSTPRYRMTTVCIIQDLLQPSFNA